MMGMQARRYAVEPVYRLYRISATNPGGGEKDRRETAVISSVSKPRTIRRMKKACYRRRTRIEARRWLRVDSDAIRSPDDPMVYFNAAGNQVLDKCQYLPGTRGKQTGGGIIKKLILVAMILAGIVMPPFEKTQAQVPLVGLLSSAIKKIITALDLKVQQLQNQTIALQSAQQRLQNSMSLGKLNDITGWIGKERSLYQNYYQELATVKTVISDYDEVRRIISQQEELLREYKSASSLFNQDKHFSAIELGQMMTVYKGILQESQRNLDEVLLAVKSFSTQMSDAERMLLVHQASAGMQKNLDDLRQFNHANAGLSLQRSKNEQDKEAVKQLYGIHE